MRKKLVLALLVGMITGASAYPLDSKAVKVEPNAFPCRICYNEWTCQPRWSGNLYCDVQCDEMGCICVDWGICTP